MGNLFELGITIIVDPHSLFKGFSLYRDYSICPPITRQRLFELKRSGYFQEEKKGKERKWALTSKGRLVIIKNILRDKKSRLKWDGKWRAIIFDIPELSRKDRDFLRKELKWIGFQELQKSVWVFPYEIEKELVALLNLWKIQFKGDIRFLTIEKMDDKDLKKYYQLA